jgi:hypothetical protein
MGETQEERSLIRGWSAVNGPLFGGQQGATTSYTGSGYSALHGQLGGRVTNGRAETKGAKKPKKRRKSVSRPNRKDE